VEKSNRANIEKALSAFKHDKKSPIASIMENEASVPEDSHQCHYCTDFAYASMLLCGSCKFQYCIYHGLMCGCEPPILKLVYRFATSELDSMLGKITRLI
jgi:hypothetical protein